MESKEEMLKKLGLKTMFNISNGENARIGR